MGRTPTATRQLASRARRRVQGTAAGDADRARQREIIDAFLTAARDGNFAALLATLDPEVVVHADPVAVETAAARASWGAPTLAPEVRGAAVVAEGFCGRARAARAALVDGVPGAAWVVGGAPRAVFTFTVSGGKISAIDIVMDPDHLAELDVALDG